ncbi:hypothetical protein BG004_007840, partial [Podila humilis]
MRLFRESMAKIPFQDRDIKNSPQRIQYASQLGQRIMDLKGALYQIVSDWHLTGGSAGSYKPVSGASRLSEPFTGSIGGGGLMDWIRRGGDPPLGVLSKIKEQVRRMLMDQTAQLLQRRPQSEKSSLAVLSTSAPPALSGMDSHCTRTTTYRATQTDVDTDANTGSDTDTDEQFDLESQHSRFGGHMVEVARVPVWRELQSHSQQNDPQWLSGGNGTGDNCFMQSSSSKFSSMTLPPLPPLPPPRPSQQQQNRLSSQQPSIRSNEQPDQSEEEECDAIVRAIERAVTMVEVLQWAVDQYGYMLYRIQPRFQRLLELELKIVYGSRLDSVAVNMSSPVSEKTVPHPPPLSTSARQLQVCLGQDQPLHPLEESISADSFTSQLGEKQDPA